MGNTAENQEENGEVNKEDIGNEEAPSDTQINNQNEENNLNNGTQENNIQQRIVIMETSGEGGQSNLAQNQYQGQIDAQYQMEQEGANQEYDMNQGYEEGEEQENNEEYQQEYQQDYEEEYQQEQEEGEAEEEYQINEEMQENQENEEYEGNQEYEENQEMAEGGSYQISQEGQSYQINQVRSADQNAHSQPYQISQINQVRSADQNAQSYQINQVRPAIHESREYHYKSGDNSYHVKKEYTVEETFQNNPNYPGDNSLKGQYESSQVNSSLRKNIRITPKDSLPKVYIQSSGYYDNIAQGRYQHHGDIPRYISFQKSTDHKKNVNANANIRSSLNVVKTENISELIEIPRSEYGNYQGRETIFLGGGMDTGEYKFRGQGFVITQGEVPDSKIVISEEEILKEIARRKNKPRKQKKKRYEVLDRFYAITEFDGKPIKKIEKVEHQQKGYSYEEQQKYYSSSQGQAYQYSSGQAQQSQSQSQSQFQMNQYSQNQNYGMSGMSGMSMNMKMGMGMNNSNNFKLKNVASSPSDNYSKYLLEQINKVRTDPQSFIGIIEDAKNNIIKDKHGRLIYNGKIKIALTDGEAAFNNAINFLKNLQPMEKLEYNPYITVELPQTENELKYKNDLTLKVDNMLNNGISIKSYWRDVIKDPEISFLMMMVDDNGIKSGMRRKDLMDPKMKYIGISSIEINGNFVCYITLSSVE